MPLETLVGDLRRADIGDDADGGDDTVQQQALVEGRPAQAVIR